MFSCKSMCGALCGAATLTGCVGGIVLDAETGVGVADAEVLAYARCVGDESSTGCVPGQEQRQTTNERGAYAFDAHGAVHGDENVQRIGPLAGDKAIRLVVSKAGYRSQTLYAQRSQATVDAFLANIDNDEYVPESATRMADLYLCPTGATDSDGDTLCDAAEAHYGTDPFLRDTDGDALPDNIELFGDGDTDLRFYGASPLHKDLFVEIDYFDDIRRNGQPYTPVLADFDTTVAGFANAPVDNPDGEPGIALHIVISDAIPGNDDNDMLVGASLPANTYRAQWFDPRKAHIFRYALIAKDCEEGWGGVTTMEDVSLTIFSDNSGNPARSLMHELGHTMGLRHGGHDDRDDKPHYFSVMNVRYQQVRFDGADRLDFSRVDVAGMVESSLSETQAFAPLRDTTEADLAHYSVACNQQWLSGNASANLDLNRDGVIQTTTLSHDLNCVRVKDDLNNTFWTHAQQDWETLTYDSAGRIGRVRQSATALAPGELVHCK